MNNNDTTTKPRDNTQVPYLIQGSNIVVVVDNKSYTVTKTDVAYNKLKEAIKVQDWALVRELVDPTEVVINYGQGNVRIEGETVLWRGVEMHGALSRRMIEMLREDFPIEPLVKFMDNLMGNPSNRAVTELYGFLEKNNLPVTPDGHFLAYKKVRDDYLDVYSGKISNAIGQVVEMPRNQVNDNKEQTCSSGLHFCSQEYLNSFGGTRVMILKINPADVVSIPTDYNNSKGRCCRYEVVGELGVTPEEAFVSPVQDNSTDNTPPKDDIYDGMKDNKSGPMMLW